MSCPPDDIRASVNKSLYGDLVRLVACNTSYDYVLGKISAMVSAASLTREDIIEAAREGGRQVARELLDALIDAPMPTAEEVANEKRRTAGDASS